MREGRRRYLGLASRLLRGLDQDLVLAALARRGAEDTVRPERVGGEDVEGANDETGEEAVGDEVEDVDSAQLAVRGGNPWGPLELQDGLGGAR